LETSRIAATQFSPDEILDVREYGSGNVNDTFIVTCKTSAPFILQRINTHVFPHPEYIMLNMRTFTEHVRERLAREPAQDGRAWEVPRVFAARDGRDYFIDADGAFWRAISFIANAVSYDEIVGLDHAREAGYALGRFQDLISDLPIDRLRDTLEGFHITPQYLAQYHVAAQKTGVTDRDPRVRHGHRFIADRQAWAGVLQEAQTRGALFLRPIHGDPKINNIMIDRATGQAISLVDLDTVKPGLIHYDIGDCLRSCCNPLGEETEQIADVRFETDLCRAILQGYLSVAQQFLTENDYAYLYDSIRLIAFELGLRFFTDYLNGNIYFKVKHAEHNLLRALVQFQVTASIEAQETEIRAIIDEQRPDFQRGSIL